MQVDPSMTVTDIDEAIDAYSDEIPELAEIPKSLNKPEKIKAVNAVLAKANTAAFDGEELSEPEAPEASQDVEALEDEAPASKEPVDEAPVEEAPVEEASDSDEVDSEEEPEEEEEEDEPSGDDLERPIPADNIYRRKTPGFASFR